MKKIAKGIGIVTWGLCAVYGLHRGTSDYLTYRQETKLNQELKQSEYNWYWEELFGSHEYSNPSGSTHSPYGLADKNENGIIELEEQVDAWTKMGYWHTPLFEGKMQEKFPKPSLKEVRKARDWYRQNLKREYPRLYSNKYK